jgi:hypothetical protein
MCSGPSDGTSLRAIEHVTGGKTVCLDGEVSMSLTPAGELDWHWTGNGPQATTAEAVLRRSK